MAGKKLSEMDEDEKSKLPYDVFKKMYDEEFGETEEKKEPTPAPAPKKTGVRGYFEERKKINKALFND